MESQSADSLAAADLVFSYTANLGWDVKEALVSLGEKALYQDDLGALIEAITAAAIPGDHILIMSNGGFGGIHEKLLVAMRDRFKVAN